VTGICLAVAAVIRATLPGSEFTLAWTHSVEKTRWEERYRVESGAIVPVEARIRGSGAGMDPPPGAILRDGAWRYKPQPDALPRLRVTISPYAGDYELCAEDGCTPLSAAVHPRADVEVVDIYPCGPAP
jgi:hypothetical protein